MKTLFAISASMAVTIIFAAEQNTSNSFINCAISSWPGDFEISIGTTNKSFTAGQSIILEATVKNLSTNTVLINDRDGIIDFSFQVFGDDGKRVGLTEYGGGLLYPVKIFHHASAKLEPGQSLSEKIPLDQAYALTNLGEYKISASWKTPSGQQISAGPLKIEIIDSVK